VLQVVGRLLSSAGRPSDTFVRFSGQEFAVILPRPRAREPAPSAERLRKGCRERQLRPPAVTVSIGAATLAKEGQEAIS